MNALLAFLVLATYLGVAFFFNEGPTAVLACTAAAVTAGLIIQRAGGPDRELLLRIFIAGLLLRMAAGTVIYAFNLQGFFGGDAITYHDNAYLLIQWWQDGLDWGTYRYLLEPALGQNGGMIYYVGGIYWVSGPNMLAIQYINAVMGAATAPVIFMCALHIFRNTRVARLSAYFVAFYPSLVLWSSQGLKDGPIVFLLALVMLATLKLGERWNSMWLTLLVGSLLSLLALRFYIFYMAAPAVLGAFVVGMTRQTTQSLARQAVIILSAGLALTYLGVLRTASRQLDTFADLDRIQTSRADLAGSAQSGFGRDIDVSTSSGALSAIPVGLVYLLFAPFPWQVTNLRQSITLPEMIVWWASFPLLVLGAYFTIKYRLRQALPILIFTTMLTLAYSIFQGNVGTAYRQRSQILVFYFIFVAVGYVLMKERREDRRRLGRAKRGAYVTPPAVAATTEVAAAASKILSNP